MPSSWTPEELLRAARGYQVAAVLAAGAELDLFGLVSTGPLEAGEVARRAGSHPEATAVLMDALAALGLLCKEDGAYALPAQLGGALTEGAPDGVIPMVRHQANCMRRWAQLGAVCRDGGPARREFSIRGEEGDRESFINAMTVASRPQLEALVPEVVALEPRHLLDVGGGPGTWSIAFLQARPELLVTYLDLPEVVPIARRHVEAAGLADRATFATGNYLEDALPAGADLAWVSAIVHQHSREENRQLLGRVREALVPGGQVVIRDVFMDSSRTRPAGGALFAINMLVATEGGCTFTVEEMAEDLEAAGFEEPRLMRQGEYMDSLVRARKGTH